GCAGQALRRERSRWSCARRGRRSTHAQPARARAGQGRLDRRGGGERPCGAGADRGVATRARAAGSHDARNGRLRVPRRAAQAHAGCRCAAHGSAGRGGGAVTQTPIVERTGEYARREPSSGGQREAALLRLSTTIAAAENEEAISKAVAGGLQGTALGFDFVAVLLVDEATGDRVLTASSGWAGAPAGLRVKPGQGLSELPLLDGRLHYTPQVTHDTRYLPTRNEGSEVDVPLLVNRKLVGVLVVESNR